MRPNKILMCRPDYFSVDYQGNNFMDVNNPPDKAKAIEQWENLKSIYQDLNFEVIEILPVENLPDMVFTANQSFPFMDEQGNKKVILSKMKNPQRMDEVLYFKKLYQSLGYEIIELPDTIKFFESMGDSIVDYERKIIFGGYGQRSQIEVYEEVSKHTKQNVVTLQLVNPNLYHLDTCFSILNSKTVVIDQTAFTENDLEVIKSHFENVIEVDNNENMKYFVCNCHCPDGVNVIVQSGADKFPIQIKDAGFSLIETDTSEFMKSGGSVFCMKMMMW